MDWAAIHSWGNTILLGGLGVFALATRRWKHLKWFPVYAFIVTLLAIVKLPWFNTHEVSIANRLMGELLCLGAVAEALRKDAKKQPHWLWFALLGLTVVPFLPLNRYLLYYLPQEIFAVGLAMELPTALKTRRSPLLGWAIIGAATLTSDILKLTIAIEEIVLIIRFLDPWFFTVMVVVMFGSLFQPEIERWILPAFKKIKALADRPIALPQPAVREPSAKKTSAAKKSAVVIPLASRAKEKADNRELYPPWSEIEERLEAIEELIRSMAAEQITVRKIRRMMLSPTDLAIYLGTTEELARKFVDEHGISKLQLSKAPDEWLVFRADVDDMFEEP